MAAKAILTCRPNSHPFQDRAVSLDQPVKIGRAVARAKPTASNAIFDCKVLSRNHALLWYETGKFYLQDTKSSNGTFVNNQRLSKSSEESLPREVCSGDIVQFGVDVMEINKKVTHGCIVATLQLFLPDGKEAKASSSTSLPDKVPATSVQEIYQLNQCIKEAMQREQMIEAKLATMRDLMSTTKDSVESNWKLMIEEDRLLTRVDILERQLQTSHKSMTDDKLREEVLQLQDDKEKYQAVAKEAIRKANLDKAEALKNVHDLQRSVNNAETEKSLLKEMLERSNQELKELSEKYEESEAKTNELTEEASQTAAKYKQEMELLNEKIKDLEAIIEEKTQQIESLMAKAELDNGTEKTHNSDVSKSHNEAPIIGESDSISKEKEYPDGNMNVHWENPTDMETLKSQVKCAEIERKEILSNLSHLLNIIEDLKTVSNKSQPTEFIQDLVQKLEIEVKQIRNFSQREEPIYLNSYNITEKVDEEQQLDNHTEHKVPDSNQNIEKLLEESRMMNKSLQSDNCTTKQENRLLQEKLTETVNLRKESEAQVKKLMSMNEDLKEELLTVEQKLDKSELTLQELNVKIKSLKETHDLSEAEINMLTEKAASWESLVKDRDIRISDLLAQLEDLKLSESKFEKSKLNITHEEKQRTFPDLSKSLMISDDVTNRNNVLNEQLLRLEEELATYKASYNDCAAECGTLRRKLTDLQSQHEGFHNQSKLGYPLHIIIPVLVGIIVFAILIAMRPSS